MGRVAEAAEPYAYQEQVKQLGKEGRERVTVRFHKGFGLNAERSLVLELLRADADGLEKVKDQITLPGECLPVLSQVLTEMGREEEAAGLGGEQWERVSPAESHDAKEPMSSIGGIQGAKQPPNPEFPF